MAGAIAARTRPAVRWARRHAAPWWHLRRDARLFSDLRSLRRFRRTFYGRRPSDAEHVSLRVRALGGARVLVRPGSSDAQVLLDTFVGGYHRPPADLDPTTIVDLGSNIGLTLADLAAHHRRATVVGVELDEDNAALAEMNVEAWRERCTVVRAAVWIDDGEVTYELTPGREYAARIGDGDRTTRSISIDTLTAGLPKVDYLKMDIEGAEAQVLRANTDWAAKVASIKVETHPPYTRDDCTRDLTALGFIVVVDPHHTRAVLGRRGQSGGR